MSVIVLCGTVIWRTSLHRVHGIEQEIRRRVGDLARHHDNLDRAITELSTQFEESDLAELKTRVGVLETNQVVMLKTVEEAKKMMSQQNMAASVAGIRMR